MTLFVLSHIQCALADLSLAKAIAELQRKVDGEVQVGVDIVDLENGASCFSHDRVAPIVPASVMKLVTSYVALNELGGEWSFTTVVYSEVTLSEINGNKKGYAGNLYIRGNGDPGMTTEKILNLANELHLSGIRSIDNLIVDDSLFVSPRSREGLNPYQAAQSALPLNFNTVEIHVSPTAIGAKAIVEATRGSHYRLSTDVRTSKKGGFHLDVGESSGDTASLRVTGEIGVGERKQIEYIAIDEPTRHFASVLADSLRRDGIEIRGAIKIAEVPSKAQKIYSLRSSPVYSLVGDMNRFSSNFIAGQLVYALGEGGDGRFRFEDGIQRVRSSIKNIYDGEFELADGSGLSRKTRIPPALLSRILVKTYGDLAVSPDLFGSLSRYNVRGTLKNRDLGSSQQGKVWGKTGTLDGVSSVAGIAQSKSGKRFSFVIITNGIADKGLAIQFEDRILSALLSDSLVK